MRTRLLFSAGLLLFVFSCSKEMGDPKVEVDCSQVTFSNDIVPILNTHCVSCHTGSFSQGDFTNYSGIKPRADNGKVKQWAVDSKLMPPSGPLPPSEIKKIQCWLDAGAPNN